MPIAGPRYRFNAGMVDGAPEERGVYGLWDGEDLIFLGRSQGALTIQHALREHLSGRAGPCTSRATHYAWELCFEPAEREAELLAAFKAQFRRVPRCNAEPP
jgi:hypothetical protein